MYNDKAHVTMKPMTRELKIPKESKVIGVVGDNEGERVNIDIPRWYDGIDLGSKSIYIVVSNDAAESDTVIPDVEKDEEQLHITWVVQGKHVANEGSVYAHIRATDENGFVWQSFDGEFEVTATQEGPEVMPDAQITAVNQKLQEIDTAKQQALSAAQDAITAATQIAPPIVADAQGDVIAIEDSADRPVKKLTIYGRTTQNGTPSPDAQIALESVGADGELQLSSKAGEVEGGNEHITIITQPRNVTAPVGASVVFSVVAHGEGMTYQWKASTNNGGVWSNSSMESAKTPDLTITAKAYMDGYLYRCLITDASGNELYTDIAKLTIGDTVVTQNPAIIQTTTITTENGLPGVPVSSGGNYTDANGQQWIADSIEYDADDKIENYVQRIKQAVFNGSETWIASSTNTTGKMRFRCAVPDIIAPENASVVGSVMCDHYKATTENLTYTGNVGIAIGVWGGSVVVFVCDDRYSDVNEWKANLSANPIKCQFALSAPIETALSAEEAAALASLRTHYPVTTIYNDEGAHMAVGYVADTKNYIDRKIRSIAAAMINNI